MDHTRNSRRIVQNFRDLFRSDGEATSTRVLLDGGEGERLLGLIGGGSSGSRRVGGIDGDKVRWWLTGIRGPYRSCGTRGRSRTTTTGSTSRFGRRS